MTQGDSATSRVDIINTEAENLSVCFDDGSEGLVKLPYGNVGFGEARLGEELLNYGGWGDRKVDGICGVLVSGPCRGKWFEHTNSGISIGDDFGEDAAVLAVLLCHLFASQNKSRRSVAEG
jgi:hypothetical protein